MKANQIPDDSQEVVGTVGNYMLRFLSGPGDAALEVVEACSETDRMHITEIVNVNDREAERLREGLTPEPATSYAVWEVAGINNQTSPLDDRPAHPPFCHDATLWRDTEGRAVLYVAQVRSLTLAQLRIIVEFATAFPELAPRCEGLGRQGFEVIFERTPETRVEHWFEGYQEAEERETATRPNDTLDGDIDYIAARVFKSVPNLPWRETKVLRREETAITSRQLLLPEVALPGGETSISETSERLAKLMATNDQYMVRGGVPVRCTQAEGNYRIDPIRPAALCSIAENVSRLVRVKKTDEGTLSIPVTCDEKTARLILASPAFQSTLPQVRVISRCPVLAQRSSGRLVEIFGFDRDSGILASGGPLPELSFAESRTLIESLLNDFRFATNSDRTRAIAALLTPALVQGGLLRARVPMTLVEADDSQAGKGFFVRLVAAQYGTSPAIVTQRNGGVGHAQETFDAHLIRGAWFICFDNVRGKFDIPGLESFLREPNYPARIPHTPTMLIDPTRVFVSMTANRAEVTKDLANRSSCIRLLKQPAGYKFNDHAEGNLVDHVAANHPRYLSAIFGVVREWHRLGKPLLAGVSHDFHEWARSVGWIVEHLFETSPLLDGHSEVQSRIATPDLNWVRDLVIAMRQSGHSGAWLRTNQLLRIVVNQRIATPGIDHETALDEDEFVKANRRLGLKLGRVFAERNTIEIDGFVLERGSHLDDSSRPQVAYRLSDEPDNF